MNIVNNMNNMNNLNNMNIVNTMNVMNETYRYILEPYKSIKSRTTCPACNKKNQFAKYIDIETNEHLSDIVGRCNRQLKCNYHFTPRQYFEDNKHLKNFDKKQIIKSPIIEIKQNKNLSSEIPFNLFKKTRKKYEQNNFFCFIQHKIGNELALKIFSLYHIGTSKHWKGSTIFWQINISGKIKAGKVMLYNKETGKRIKEPFPHITWIHKLINLKDYELNQCFFGEHLISQFPEKPIAITESEKTAILAAAYIPKFNWLAAGNLNNLSRKRCEVLKGKTIVLFPDAGAFQIWNQRAKILSDIATFIVSDLIETKGTLEQIKEGFDLADYFENKPKEMFISAEEFEQNPKNNSNERETALNKNKFNSLNSENLKPKKEATNPWQIKNIENYFTSIQIPKNPIKLHDYLTIINPSKFISNHLSIVKANNGKPIYKSYYDCLIELKEYFENLNGGMG